jgi:outer membrane protein assembly factor BamB
VSLYAPTIGSDGTIYIGASDANLYAFNSNGRIKWRYTAGGPIASSPAIASDGTIYIGASDANLYAINPNGSLKWRYTTVGPLDQSPAIGSDGTIYVSSYIYTLNAINPNGSLKWEFYTVGAITTSPAIGSDGTIYVGCDDNRLYAIDLNGELEWQYDSGNPIYSSPAIGSDGTIYFGSGKKLIAIRSTGSLLWDFEASEDVRSSPSIGSDGTVYVGSDDRNLYAVSGVNINKYLNINTLIGEGGTYTTPIIGSSSSLGYLNNNLYYRTAEIVLSARNLETGDLTVVAGNGTNGLPVNGSVPSISALPQIRSFHVDSTGNIYIAVFSAGNTILMIPRHSGVYFNVAMVADKIYSIAGGLVGSSSPTEGSALSSRFLDIICMTVDYQGNLFSSNSAGPNLDGSQCITMMPAANGTFFGRDMVVGNIYVLTYNSIVPGENSSVFTGYDRLATSARLNSARGLVTDSLGNLIVADSFHSRIAMITRVPGTYFGVNMPNVGFIYLVAGNGANAYAGDGVLAVNASLRVPAEMILDRDGNLIFSDSFNNRIRNIGKTGYITNVAGNSPSGPSAGSFGGDGGLANSAQLRRPRGLALGNSNTIYVLDEDNNRIRILYK